MARRSQRPARLRVAPLLALALLQAPLPCLAREVVPGPTPVVLLHGLARTSASMEPLAEAVRAAGHPVCNVDYPSRRHGVRQLALEEVLPRIQACWPGYRGPVSLVTHSLGGLVAQELALSGRLPVARIVMLAPPNHGSEVIDAVGDVPLFRRIAGPVTPELRSRPPRPVPYAAAPAGGLPEIGVLAGNRTVNPWLSLLFLPGDDDGKVTVASTRLPGMRDFRVLPCSHPFILRDRMAIGMTLNFLASGCFTPGPRQRSCLQDGGAAARPEGAGDGTPRS